MGAGNGQGAGMAERLVDQTKTESVPDGQVRPIRPDMAVLPGAAIARMAPLSWTLRGRRCRSALKILAILIT
ncbi:hypothetical protein D3C87_1970650 [compost metagenome]